MEPEVIAFLRMIRPKVAEVRVLLDACEAKLAAAREHAENSTGPGCCDGCAAWWELAEVLK